LVNFVLHKIVAQHRGFTNTYHHTVLLGLDGVNDKEGSNFYLGKKVAYIYKAQKSVSGSKFRVVWGKVMRAHGTNGVVRAKFNTNLTVSVIIMFFVLIVLCIINPFLFGIVHLFWLHVTFPELFVFLQSTAIGSGVRVMLYPSNV
jgi:large subunit ribosomal protein L35Ae